MALTILDGGASVSDERELIADACERGLTELHPLHPRRQDLLRTARHAQRAAGRAPVPFLRGA